MSEWAFAAFALGILCAFFVGSKHGQRRNKAAIHDSEHAHRLAREALGRTEILLAHQQALMDSIDDLAWLKDKDCRFLVVNRRFHEVFDKAPGELIGKTDYDLSPPDMAAHYQEDDRAVMLAAKPKRVVEQIHRPNGEMGWSETVKVPVFDSHHTVIGTAGIARDITIRKRYEQEVEFLAWHDPLTGLFNRHYLEAHFDEFAAEHPRFAVFFLDLDNFKLINDTDGHSVGDTLLRLLAQRLNAELIHGDQLVRLGGDEFLLLRPVSPDTQPDHLEAFAMQLEALIATPYEIGQSKYVVSSSIGIALHPDHGQDRQTLIKHADIAMYEAKKEGRNRFCWFREVLADEAILHRSIERQLRDALERNRFELHYQPINDARSGRIVAAEALLRLRDQNGRLVSPATFIPIAEQSGLINPIGAWVIRTGLRQLAEWRANGYPNLRLAINISGIQFAEPHFVDQLAAALEEAGLPGEALELELTEGILMADVQRNLDTLNRIRALGVELAVDDFGTGYSSLAYLKRLPIQRLKIDRSFVIGLPVNVSDSAITRSILHLAHSFQLQVTAEGVETPEQLAFLREAGCPAVQGFLFSSARPPKDFELLLHDYSE